VNLAWWRRRARRPTDGSRGRVLIVVQNLPVLIDRRVWSECGALRDAGYQVSVICPKGEPDEPSLRVVDGVRIHTYREPATSSGLLGYGREFAVCWLRTARLSLRVRRAEGFDILQACNPPDTYWLLGLFWKVVAGTWFVYDQHDLCPEVYEARFGRRGVLHRLLLVLEKATYRVADHVICPNPSYQEVALTRGRLSVRRTTVVMSAPDSSRMCRGEVEPALRHGKRHLVAYVGIMGPQDGVDTLVDAIDAYVHRLGRRDAHFVLLGFGDCLDELRERASRLDVTSWITFTGRVDQQEIGRWLSAAAVGVTPDPPNEFNDRSTMNKTLEYMAHGVPVLATGLHETRRCAGDAAVYVDDGGAEGIASALAELLDDPHGRGEMSRAGRMRIERLFDWRAQAEKYVGVFERLLSLPNPAWPADLRRYHRHELGQTPAKHHVSAETCAEQEVTVG
jgi:glycosyltransferase involved in cell wall biosynthesis